MPKGAATNRFHQLYLLIFINNFLAIKLKYSSPVLYLMTKEKTMFICTNSLTIVLIILSYTINTVQLEKKTDLTPSMEISSTLLWTYASTKVHVFGFAFFFFHNCIAKMRWGKKKQHEQGYPFTKKKGN